MMRLSHLVLGPWWSALQRRQSPLIPMLASVAAPRSSPVELVSMLGRVLRMAVPKKRTSHTRSRTRRVNEQKTRGPHLQEQHIYTCPVCERMRLPHRVCGREDCQTYFKRALPFRTLHDVHQTLRACTGRPLASADRWF